MRTLNLGAMTALALALTAAPVFAQSSTGGGPQSGGSSTPGGGTSNAGPAAGDLTRSRPSTQSNNPSDISGAAPGLQTGSAVQPVKEGVKQKGDDKPAGEVTRSDSAR